MGQVFPAGQDKERERKRERKRAKRERHERSSVESLCRDTCTCADVVHGITDTWYAKTIHGGFEPIYRNIAVRNCIRTGTQGMTSFVYPYLNKKINACIVCS